jgi:hypothetical protein
LLVEDSRETTRRIEPENVARYRESVPRAPGEVDQVVADVGKVVVAERVDTHLAGR